MSEKVQIGSISVNPKSKKYDFLKVGELYDGSPVNIPIMVVNGVESKPRLLLIAAVHGDEVVGTEAIKRVISKIDPEKFKGVVIGIPVLNMPAYLASERVNVLEVPKGSNDLERFFTKSINSEGCQSERIAYVLQEEIFPKVDYVIDLHSSAIGSNNFPRAIICGNYVPISEELREKIDELAVASAFELIFRPQRPPWPGMYFTPGALWEESYGKATIVLETGASPTIDDADTIISGITNIMKHLGMLEGLPTKAKDQIFVERLIAVRANKGGIFRPRTKIGDYVKQDEVIAEVTNLFDDVVEEIKSPEYGLIIKHRTSAFVGTGERVFVIAPLEEVQGKES